ncbi:MAG: respiratory nitrate reductase subunit gamma [Candidatus Sumerlaeaceae bacterium]|nr:respiratory nitrate reductase subunit gamma [Candidatus Sumerlaeaceae bacterium]
MLNALLFVGLPYVAIFVCIAGSIYRFHSNRFSYSALSSQFLENKKLLWGSVPWHIGLGILFVLHLLPVLMPGPWAVLVANTVALWTIEIVGLAAAILALGGLGLLIFRRLVNPYVQAISTSMDFVVLALFLGQIILGIVTALSFRWGARWAPGTTTPYLWSLLTLQPDPSYVADMPVVIKMHITGAWLIVLAIPFSRLVHVFSLPFEYLFRRPQKVVWNNPRRSQARAAEVPVVEERRLFLRGFAGLAAGGALLSVGVLDKLVRFYRGPSLSPAEEAELMERNVKKLQMTLQEREFELERMRQDYILVARLSELDARRGKYFIDYQMRPALAYLGEDGLPLFISAKCTHLGCTVQSDMNAEGKILCPCHVSYFDVKTGEPTPGSPALTPLPHIGWVVMDDKDQVIASKWPGKAVVGKVPAESKASCRVFIAKEHGETA